MGIQSRVIILIGFMSLISFGLNAAQQDKAQTDSKKVVEKTDEKKSNNVQVMTRPAEQTAIGETVLGMNVSGNKELPNVLYVVPWKDDSGLNVELKATRLVNEIYAPVDADTFAKKVKLFKQLNQDDNNIKSE